MIKVKYDGKYPIACSGNLKIWRDGKLIYDKNNCCISTGKVYFDNNWNEIVIPGRLKWEDANKFSEDIIEAVNKELEKVKACCGGCI